MIPQIKKAKEYFYEKKYKEALEIFENCQELYYSGLCSLLLKDEQKAKDYFEKSCSYSPSSQWGLAVLDLIHLKRPKKRPSFFQTRAFLEIYISFFIENGLIEWAENMVSMCDTFYLSNPESYKFIARALFANGYFDLAMTFCEKSLKLFYVDPEAFLILSQCHYLKGNLGEALDCVNRINALISDYYPTILFRDVLKKEIAKKYAS